MAKASSAVRQRFPLSTLEGVLAKVRLPAGTFDAGGSWSGRYGICATLRGPQEIGSVRLQRTATDEGATLKVQIAQVQPDGCSHRVAARLNCRSDSLSTPKNWTFKSELVRAGKAVRHTQLQRSATVRGGKLVMTDSAGRRTVDLPDPYTVNWAIFDAVCQLPRKAFKPIPFTLLDDFDQLKAEQVLSYRTGQTVSVGGRKTRVHAIDHLGRGVLPWTYFVNDSGALLLAVSGLKAYLRTGAARTKGGER